MVLYKHKNSNDYCYCFYRKEKTLGGEKVTRINFSKKREAIYQTIKNTKSHPSAEWVYNSLKEEYPSLSLGTVYRNMSMFREKGVIQSVGTVNGQERFDGNVKPHPHFICRSCYAVTDMEHLDYNEFADETVRKNYGHRVDHHKVFFYGVCKKCLDA